MQTYYSFYDVDVSHVYYVQGTPERTWWFNWVAIRWQGIPPNWKWVKWTVEEFIPYYEWKVDKLQTMDTTYMSDACSKYDWKVNVTVTRDPDTWKVTHLHTKFLPTMNAYNTLVIKKDTTTSGTAQKKPKPSELVVIPFEVRLGRSSENVKAELLRLIPEDIDVDDVEIMIQEIF